MVIRRLKGVHRVRKTLATGATVEYHFIRGKGGPAFWRSTDGIPVGSDRYTRLYEEAKGLREPAAHGDILFRKVIHAYLASPDFKRLSERTQRDYRRWTDRLEDRFGGAPREAFNRPEIVRLVIAWRDQWTGKQAHYAWQVAHRVTSWAKKNGWLMHNHLKGAGTVVYRADRAEIVWTAEEQAAVSAHAHWEIQRVLAGALETGLRPSDLVRLDLEEHVRPTRRGRQIAIKTAKSRFRRSQVVPVTPAMAKILDETPPGRSHVFATPAGNRLTAHYASQLVRQAIVKAKITRDLHLYDCRGTAATRLFRAGAPISEIAPAMNWSIETAHKIIMHYVHEMGADTDATLDRLLKAAEDEARRAESVNQGVNQPHGGG